MSIDTLEIVNLTVSDQAFAEVLDVDPFWFRYAHFDGVLGLGLADWPPSGRLPLIENMLARDQLDQPIASLYFTLGNTSRDSRLILGGVDTQLFKGPLTRLPLRDNSTHWDINLDSMRIGNVSFEPKGWHVRFDSMKFSIGVPSYLRDILSVLLPFQSITLRWISVNAVIAIYSSGHIKDCVSDAASFPILLSGLAAMTSASRPNTI